MRSKLSCKMSFDTQLKIPLLIIKIKRLLLELKNFAINFEAIFLNYIREDVKNILHMLLICFETKIAKGTCLPFFVILGLSKIREDVKNILHMLLICFETKIAKETCLPFFVILGLSKIDMEEYSIF